MGPAAEEVRSWAIHFYQGQLSQGHRNKVAKVKAVAQLRRKLPTAILAEALPDLKAQGSVAYGLAMRAHRLNLSHPPKES